METTQQLEEKLKEKVDKELVEKIDLSVELDLFHKYVRQTLDLSRLYCSIILICRQCLYEPHGINKQRYCIQYLMSLTSNCCHCLLSHLSLLGLFLFFYFVCFVLYVALYGGKNKANFLA